MSSKIVIPVGVGANTAALARRLPNTDDVTGLSKIQTKQEEGEMKKQINSDLVKLALSYPNGDERRRANATSSGARKSLGSARIVKSSYESCIDYVEI
jgi:hypothetical protein